jgi:Na+/H+ antiporter NhaD/arsenite permease-like protein
MSPSLVVLAISYLLIAAPRVPGLRLDRPAVALIGAVAMVLVGSLDLRGALAAVNLEVLGLLLGTMLLSAYLQEARFFRATAWWILTRAGSAMRLLWALVFTAGALSAVLLNDTVCLMVTPLVLAVVAEAGLPALPYLLALASASNIGGVVSFTGNPQNMLIGQAVAGHLGYLDYTRLTLPVGVLGLAVDAALLGWLFRRELRARPLHPGATPRPHLDRGLAGTSLAALALFVVACAAGAPLAGAALGSAGGLCLCARRPLRPVLARIDWSLLLFFAGLFVLVAGASRDGALAGLHAAIAPLRAQPPLWRDLGLVGITLVGCNLVSNVPFVVIALAWLPALGEPAHVYALLAVASTLAGNLTPLGSVANLIVLELAGTRGEIGLVRFVAIGAVLTAGTMAIALVALWCGWAAGLG